MTETGAGLPALRWALRDWLAAAGLFAATAAVILWQNAHLAVFWDISYVLDSATRIALGQVPYRDFPFVHAPLTFLIQAAIIHFTGRVYFHHVLYVATLGGVSTVLTWRIVLHLLHGRLGSAWRDSAWIAALMLAAPLTVLGIYCVFPFPSYDCDCAFSILVAVYLLQRLTLNSELLNPHRSTNWQLANGFAAGAALCLPLFFKQNIGLPFLAGACAVIVLMFAAAFIGRTGPLPRNPRTSKSSARILLAVLAGAGATLLAALLLLHSTVGFGNYLHWTIQFASQRRLPGLHDMLAVYLEPSLLWTLPSIAAGLLLLRSRLARKRWAQATALALLVAPFLFTLGSLLLYDDADERGDTLLALWPLLLILAAALAIWNLRRLRHHASTGLLLLILILIAINGTLMSQQLWGSTYAIWPLLILLIAEMIAFLDKYRLFSPKPNARAKSPAPIMAAIVSVTLFVCGSFYTASEERLSYAQLPDEPVLHSTVPALAGMSVAGPYLPDFEELLHYAAANIPLTDGLILIPGEDPFYFATGRAPQFPVLLFDPSTDPLSPAQVVEQARQHQIRWLIVKRELQIKADPTPQRDATLNLLMGDFTLATHLHGYDVYRR